MIIVHANARAALVLIAVLFAASAHAQVTFQVNTVADLIDSNINDNVCNSSANTCSLRAALMQTNARVAAGEITILVPTGVYTLIRPITGSNGDDSGGLNLTAALGANQNVRLVGAGAANTIIDGNQLDGVLHVHSGRGVNVTRLTLRNGNRTLPAAGGGIYSESNALLIDGSVIESNRSTTGGGIYSKGYVTIVDSTIRANFAISRGGGIYAAAISQADIYRSVIHSNGAGSGGGIFSDAFIDIANVTLSSNYANGNGGGVATGDGEFYMESTSIIDNDADHDRDQNGGIGGGIYGQFYVRNSLIARNTVLGFFDDDCKGSVTPEGRPNLFGTLTGCTFVAPAPRGLVAPESIGPLQDNLGPTLTHALILGSAAINGGAGCSVGTDQRGAPRVAGLSCDVGAYEFGSIVPIVELIFKDGFE